MKYFSITFLVSCLVSVAILTVQFGCSSTPTNSQNLATAQPTVSPSPTIEPSPPVIADSPTPAAASVSRAETEKRTNVAKTPVRKPTSVSTGTADSEPTAPRPNAPIAERTAPPPPPRTSTLFEGRAISVFTSSDLSTKTARSGQRFTASLANPIVDGDWVIAKKGAPVEGVVVNSDPGGRVNGVAFISVRLESLTLADGRRVNLDTTLYTKEAKSSKTKDAAKVGIGAGIGAAIGAIAGGGKGAAIGAGAGGAGGAGVVLATRGDPAVIPSESQLTVRLTAPVTITKR